MPAASRRRAGGAQELLGIVLCMVAARSAAMAFNRLADWRLDALNPRTATRHIPAGTLERRQRGGVRRRARPSRSSLATLLFLPNRLPLYLSLPVLAFLLAYSFTKRFTAAAHFWLGAALMLAPISAWIAIRGQQVLEHPADLLPAVVLGGAVLLWVAGFDIIYACQDVEFDRAAGLHSVPARLGVGRALRLAALCHLGMVDPAGAAALGFIRTSAGFTRGRRGRGRAVGLRTLAGPARRSDARQRGVFSGQCRGEHRAVRGRQLGLARLGQAVRLKFAAG